MGRHGWFDSRLDTPTPTLFWRRLQGTPQWPTNGTEIQMVHKHMADLLGMVGTWGVLCVELVLQYCRLGYTNGTAHGTV